jgi:hypothetical protein
MLGGSKPCGIDREVFRVGDELHFDSFAVDGHAALEKSK